MLALRGISWACNMAATACGMRTPLMRFVLSRQFKSFRFPRTSLFCVGEFSEWPQCCPHNRIFSKMICFQNRTAEKVVHFSALLSGFALLCWWLFVWCDDQLREKCYTECWQLYLNEWSDKGFGTTFKRICIWWWYTMEHSISGTLTSVHVYDVHSYFYSTNWISLYPCERT